MSNELVKRDENKVTTSGNIFNSIKEFEGGQRMAMALTSSSLIPDNYRGKNNIGNCMIALDTARRLNVSPMMVMQNLYVVHGKPAWSSQYIIAVINASHKYKTDLMYKFDGKGDDYSCTAYTEDYNGNIITGPKISIRMAKAEGWWSKKDKHGNETSKWQTMPEVMLRYRAASFFGRLNCPDMIMGIYSTEEVIEMTDAEYTVVDDVDDVDQVVEQVEKETKEESKQETITINTETGEVIKEKAAEEQEKDPEDKPTENLFDDSEPDF